MKNFVITQQLPQGARFAQLSNSFELKISIIHDVVFLDFMDEQTDELLFGTFFCIDTDEGYKSFDDFSEKGQKLLLERLNEAITADIAAFISGKYDNVVKSKGRFFWFVVCFAV